MPSQEGLPALLRAAGVDREFIDHNPTYVRIGRGSVELEVEFMLSGSRTKLLVEGFGAEAVLRDAV